MGFKKPGYLAASKVEVGDAILDQSFERQQVTKIETRQMLGIYAPLSQSGRLIVDDFTTSCFASKVNQNVAKAVMLPLRLKAKF